MQIPGQKHAAWLKVLLAVVCFVVFCSRAHAMQGNFPGEILSYDIVTEERQSAQKLTPVRSRVKLTKRVEQNFARKGERTVEENTAEEQSGKEQYGREMTNIVGAPVPVQKEQKKREHIYLIDKMDVYSLSDTAKFLALPHMVNFSHYYGGNNVTDWESIINEASLLYGVDRALIWAVIKVESNFVAHAVSHKGAVGAMQIMPETQRELGLVNPINAKDNVFAGTRYLKQQLEYFKGDLELALSAYNAGAGNVIKYKGIPPFKETRNFVRKVLAHKGNWQ